jgi:hypothetical protein
MVNTFVTSSRPSAVALLDDRRLNKQRVEACQILDTITGKSSGWKNHPAVRMWKGYSDALRVYINYCIRAWLARGKNCKLEEFDVDEDTVEWPWWFSWKELHLSHKCSLLRKDPNYYSSIFVLTTTQQLWLDYGYIWPHKISSKRQGYALHPSKLCDPIGAGAPPQYRWSIAEVEEWLEDCYINPKTGRKITKTKTGIYSDVRAAYHYYQDNNLI